MTIFRLRHLVMRDPAFLWLERSCLRKSFPFNPNKAIRQAAEDWHATCSSQGVAKAGRHTLRITLQENDNALEITLEGRVAGPWVAELSRVWEETAPRLGKKRLFVDLRNVTYCDAKGKEALRDIYAQAEPEVLTSTPWTHYLAEEIRKRSEEQ